MTSLDSSTYLATVKALTEVDEEILDLTSHSNPFLQRLIYKNTPWIKLIVKHSPKHSEHEVAHNNPISTFLHDEISKKPTIISSDASSKYEMRLPDHKTCGFNYEALFEFMGINELTVAEETFPLPGSIPSYLMETLQEQEQGKAAECELAENAPSSVIVYNHGLRNYGNTCFYGSALQMVKIILDLLDYIPDQVLCITPEAARFIIGRVIRENLLTAQCKEPVSENHQQENIEVDDNQEHNLEQNIVTDKGNADGVTETTGYSEIFYSIELSNYDAPVTVHGKPLLNLVLRPNEF